MTTPEQPTSRWTKDRAGSMAAAYAADVIGWEVCHELVRPFAYASTVSVVFGVGLVAYRVMMRIMRRLP
jgi:hypothetical protein